MATSHTLTLPDDIWSRLVQLAGDEPVEQWIERIMLQSPPNTHDAPIAEEPVLLPDTESAAIVVGQAALMLERLSAIERTLAEVLTWQKITLAEIYAHTDFKNEKEKTACREKAERQFIHTEAQITAYLDQMLHRNSTQHSTNDI
jgi:hypothetical protein